MDIEFKTAKLKKTCENYELAKKQWGDRATRAIIKRLNEIQSAECIADLNHAPPVSPAIFGHLGRRGSVG